MPEATLCQTTLPLLQRPNFEVPLQTMPPLLEQEPELVPEDADPVPDGGAAAKPVEAGPETPAFEETVIVGKVDSEDGAEDAGFVVTVVIPELAGAEVAWPSLEEDAGALLLSLLADGAEDDPALEPALLLLVPAVTALAAAAQPGPVGGASFAVAAFKLYWPGSGTWTSMLSADLHSDVGLKIRSVNVLDIEWGGFTYMFIKYMFGKAS